MNRNNRELELTVAEELVWKTFHTDDGPVWLLIEEADYKAYTNASLYDCEHPESELRDRNIKGGSIQRLLQCKTCGRAAGNPIKRDPSETVPEWDNGLWDRANKECEEFRQDIVDAAIQLTDELAIQGYSDYQEYLASPKWAVKRKAVFDRDSNICQACLSREATEVHHLTYDRIFEEPMFDLVSICRECHEKLHRKKIAALAAAQAKSEKPKSQGE